MKKILRLIAVMMFLGNTAFAQKPTTEYDKEKLEAARVAFITNRLDLKPEQAEKFWPLFNQYNEERTMMMNNVSSLNRESMQDLTEARATEIIQKRFLIQQQLLEREKVFMGEITRVISPQQAIKLGGVNREFTRQVYQRHRGGRDGGSKNK
jgi:GTPase involved in cell partitioning and DNA repair